MSLSTSKINVKRCNDKNIPDYLKVLSQYYNTIDLPQITMIDLDNVDEIKTTLVRLIDNSYILVKRHQKLQDLICQLQSESHSLNQSNSALELEKKKLEKEINKLKNDIKILKEQSRLLTYHNNEETKANHQLSIKLVQIENEKKSQEKLFQNNLNKKDVICQELHNKLEKNCGKYISVDSCLAKKLKEYEQNEQRYKETISFLQQNNEDLLNEILNLKEEIIFKSLNSTNFS